MRLGRRASITIRIFRADDDALTTVFHRLHLAKELFERLTAGTGSVLAFAPGDGSGEDDSRDGAQPIARIDGVEVMSGARTDAGTMDLRDAVPTAVVRVTDAAGAPAPDAGVWWRPERATPPYWWRQIAADAQGTAVVPVLRPIRVLARRQGSRFAEARNVSGPVTLRTAPAREATVTLRWADDVKGQALLKTKAPPSRPVASRGALTLNRALPRLLVDTPRSKAVAGVLEGEVRFDGGIAVRFPRRQFGFVSLTSADGNTLQTSRDIRVFASGKS